MNISYRTFCLTLHEETERTEQSKKYFKEIGLSDVTFFESINATKLGILPKYQYRRDRKPEDPDYFIGEANLGCSLGHMALQMALRLLPDEYFWILENDVLFVDNWKDRFFRALSDVPDDMQVLYVGSCCCLGRPTTHIKGDVYEVKYPLCTHSYIVRHDALETLINIPRADSPVDISMFDYTLPKLKTYTVLPRIAYQRNTELPV